MNLCYFYNIKPTFGCGFHNYEFLLVHGVQHYINRLSATALASMPFRVEKLVYGYIEHCDKLEE